METQNQSTDRTSWAILIILSLVWGCSFILIKKALIAFSPVQLASMRLGISSLAFAPVVWYHRKNIDWNKWMKFLAVGLTGSGIPAFLFFFAQTKINSSVAGILNSLTPLWTLMIGIFIFKLQFERAKLAGLFIGFVGAVLLLGSNGHAGTNSIWHGLLVVVATLCYASSVNMVQAFFSDTRPVIISALSFFLTGPVFLVWLLFFSDFFEVLSNNPDAWISLGAVSALSLFGTVLASILFYYLVQRTSAVFGSTVTYLMPVVAMGWGILDGESVGLVHILAMAFILTGVYITKKKH
jgi:drug/metabolite transporter (DMT)-like permease